MPQPVLQDVEVARLAEIADALGVGSNDLRASAITDVGVVWITLQLADADQVRRLLPDMARITTLTPHGVAGVTVFGLESAGSARQIEVRSFAPAEGVAEDPVCGSGNGCVAALVRQLHLIKTSSYLAGQGSCVGRDGRVEVRFGDDNVIQLGGNAVTCVEGMLHL